MNESQQQIARSYEASDVDLANEIYQLFCLRCRVEIPKSRTDLVESVLIDAAKLIRQSVLSAITKAVEEDRANMNLRANLLESRAAPASVEQQEWFDERKEANTIASKVQYDDIYDAEITAFRKLAAQLQKEGDTPYIEEYVIGDKGEMSVRVPSSVERSEQQEEWTPKIVREILLKWKLNGAVITADLCVAVAVAHNAAIEQYKEKAWKYDQLNK